MARVYKMTAWLLASALMSSNLAYAGGADTPEVSEVDAALKVMDGSMEATVNAQSTIAGFDGKTDPASEQARTALTQKIQDHEAIIETTASQFKDNAKVQMTAANFWVMAGDNEKAFTHADAAVKAAEKHMTNPRNLADALQARALAEAASGDTDRARADAQQVLKMYPDDEGALLIAQMTEREGRNIPGTLSINGKRASPPGSIRGRSTGVVPGQPDARQSLAGASGVHGEAVGIEERVGVVNWQRVAASIVVNRKAIEALKRQDYPAMHSYAAQATTLFPQNVNAAQAASFASVMMGHGQDALAEASAALSLKPEAPQLLALRAQVYNQLDRPGEALKDALRAIANNPKTAEAWVQKGLAREKLGEAPDKFLPDLQKAAELYPAFQSFYREALARRDEGRSAGKNAGGAGQAPALGGFARVLWELGCLLPEEKTNPWFYRGVWAFNLTILLAGVYLARRLMKGD